MNFLGSIQHALARHATRRRFAALRCHGLDHLRMVPDGVAAMLCPVHTSWWDGFWCACLMPLLPGREFRLVQEARHLERYPWFRRAGVLGLDARSSGSLRRDLRMLRRELENPRVLMVYFPQGKLVLQDAGPVFVKPGVGWLAGGSSIPVVPLATRHGLREGSRPEVWMRIGPPVYASGAGMSGALSNALDEQSRALVRDWNEGRLDGYQDLWPPKRPINETWLRFSRRFASGNTIPRQM